MWPNKIVEPIEKAKRISKCSGADDLNTVTESNENNSKLELKYVGIFQFRSSGKWQGEKTKSNADLLHWLTKSFVSPILPSSSSEIIIFCAYPINGNAIAKRQ